MKLKNIKNDDSEELYQFILSNVNELISIIDPDQSFKFEFIK